MHLPVLKIFHQEITSPILPIFNFIYKKSIHAIDSTTNNAYLFHNKEDKQNLNLFQNITEMPQNYQA